VFRITDGEPPRRKIARIEAAGRGVAVQPNFFYQLTQDQAKPGIGAGDPAQYVVDKLHLSEVHQITTGANVVIAVIDSKIDSSHPDLSGTVTGNSEGGCSSSSPDAHGTGMAGAIASHGRLLGVAPRAKIIAICAFGGTGQPRGTTFKIIRGLDFAIQHGARIVNM